MVLVQEAAWYEWIVNSRGLLYLNEFTLDNNGDRLNEKIYLIVNPFLAPLVALTVAVCFFWVCWRLFLSCAGSASVPGKSNGAKSKEEKAAEKALLASFATALARQKKYLGVVVFFLAGYSLNILPYVAVSRCTFIYHYLYVI